MSILYMLQTVFSRNIVLFLLFFFFFFFFFPIIFKNYLTDVEYTSRIHVHKDNIIYIFFQQPTIKDMNPIQSFLRALSTVYYNSYFNYKNFFHHL